ncbi:MAG: methionine synthase [Muribaculaceae bacterium]|nr:methionine synthase [Muribaculaceae bacterium]
MNLKEFFGILRERVLVLDGAMGTMIQRYSLTECDFRGSRFENHPSRLSGCNDLLCLTRPDILEEIHKAYIEAGADIISTDTFNANAISMADYSLHDDSSLIREINRAGASIAKKAVNDFITSHADRKVFVAGSIGPTNKSATMSPDVTDPANRNITYDDLYTAYLDQAIGLIEGGVDILLFETVFDTLNLKAGLDAAHKAMKECGRELPIMVSATVSDKSGRTLSGQTLPAFATSVEDYPCVVSLGLNCSFGPKDIITHLKELGKSTSKFISVHPNAGLPDALGRYDVDPKKFVEELTPVFYESLANIVGGCCGTTPEHIAALRNFIDTFIVSELSGNSSGSYNIIHKPHKLEKALRISGLERVEVCPENNFLVVGERCNVAGSRKFLRLIKEKNYDEAIVIAAKQVEDGAMVIDINMDDPLLDAAKEMVHFLRLYASEPEVAKVPVMVDSSNWEVVESALKNLQGKSIVNSISLKEGEDAFIAKAKRIRELGAAVIVMAFDEIGQADTYQRKIEVCDRAYQILTDKCGFKGEDIIFDVNVMAVATGLEEHSRYGIDFIEAVRWVKNNLPGARTSGGISNLSFAFRGKNALREAMHTVFLYHAIAAGLDMAIMNPASAMTYDEIDPALRSLIEDVVLARRPEASDALAEYAMTDKSMEKSKSSDSERDLSVPVEKRVTDAVIAGKDDFLKEDLELLSSEMKAVDIVEGPLMEGMKRVGALFGEGKMFLPQVVKTARVMKMAVDILQPKLVAESTKIGANKAGKVLLATVKGDVHDIGKNIVSIVLACNNFDVIDLGVMVPAEDIVATAIKEQPDIICLSGLITPSLAEMAATAEALAKAGLEIPLLIGGATTSPLHTALKIAPVYTGPVVHMRDASQNPIAAAKLLDKSEKKDYIASIQEEQRSLRESYSTSVKKYLPLEEARIKGRKNVNDSYRSPEPICGVDKIAVKNFSIEELTPLINWKMLLHAWGLHGQGCKCGCDSDSESVRLINDARGMLNKISESGEYDGFGIVKIVRAYSVDDDIIVGGHKIPTLRQQIADSNCRSVSDYINSNEDFVGVFMVGAGQYIAKLRKKYEEAGDSYRALILQSLADRLAEASSELMHYLVRKKYWGYSIDEEFDTARILRGEFRGIRPAMGYPMLPDQLLNKEIFEILEPESGKRVELTENGAMRPSSTVSGLYISNPEARYFTIGCDVCDDQLDDYSKRRGLTQKRTREVLSLQTPN